MKEATTAVVLAGGDIDPELQARTGARSRAEVIVGDAPMYRHVVRALQGVEGIDAILIVGDAPHGDGYTVLPPRGSLLENVRLGLEHSPTESVLFATVDLPFLTSESVRFFLEESLRSGASLTYAVVPADLCRQRFPGMQRTTVRLCEGEFTGGNLFWARREIALRELPRLEALYRARKQPVRLAMAVGTGLLLRFLLAKWISPRLLSIEQIEKRVERILQVPVKGIITPYPEVGADIDKLEHWQAAQAGVRAAAQREYAARHTGRAAGAGAGADYGLRLDTGNRALRAGGADCLPPLYHMADLRLHCSAELAGGLTGAIACAALDYADRSCGGVERARELATLYRLTVRKRIPCGKGETGTIRAMREWSRITRDPKVMGGKPCIRGMRITVGTLVGLLASGYTETQILEAYPYLEPEDIREALAYAAWRVEEQEELLPV